MIQSIGHRGAAGLEPENTMLGFKKAIDLGVDAVELDVHLTKDGQIVVMHDDNLDRTTNMKGFIRDLDYSEMKNADAGKGERIPLLEEVFNLVKDKNIFVYIEIKESGIIIPVIDMINANGFAGKTGIISFWHKEVLKAKKIEPKIQTGLLTVHNPISAKTILNEASADCLSVVYDLVDEYLVEEVHSIGKKITVWGRIDTPEKVDTLINLNVDGIASDFPDLVVNRFKFHGRK